MMKVRFSPFVGYVHTIEAVINYAGVHAQCTFVANDPFETDNGLPEVNPLSTVPMIELADGTPLYGGPVAYEYIDGLHAKPKLFTPGPNLLKLRRQLWQADSLFDHYVRLFVESREPADKRRQPYIDRFFPKIPRSLDEFEGEVDSFPAALDIAQVRLVGSLAFLETRLPKVAERLDHKIPTHHWREGRPKLSAWFDRRMMDPIFTTPVAPQLAGR